MAQGTDGRDHNPFGFTIWLAGGGVKGGTIYGATDDYGYHAVENKVEIHDLHATMLHLLGIDHKRLTYRFGGRDMRLTDVHGEVIDGDPRLRRRKPGPVVVLRLYASTAMTIICGCGNSSFTFVMLIWSHPGGGPG